MLSEILHRSVSPTNGPAYWFLNSLNVVLATSESTGGAFSLVHHTARPDHATPYHLHHDEDEAFFVLDGEFTFIRERKKTVLGPGEYIFLPRNSPHGIRCTDTAPSTMLILAMPGTGFVGMFIQTRELLKRRQSLAQVRRVVARTRCLRERSLFETRGQNAPGTIR
jgi:quercetin dioxygenase-like cupin family protein